MIKILELISDVELQKIPEKYDENLNDTLLKLNRMREAYGKPLRVTSGFRSMEKHLAIYAAKGITDKAKIPMKSNHLYGLAADLVPIEDDIFTFQKWILDNLELMEKIGFWFEDFQYTPKWVHFQTVPPKSENRFFIP